MRKKISSVLLLLILMAFLPLISACQQEILTHQITITSSNIRFGTVQGDGYYKTGETANLIAKPISPAVFVCWVKNDEVVSTDQEFSFVVNKQTEGKYTAIFRHNPVQYYELAYFTVRHKHIYNSPGLDFKLVGIKIEMNSSASSLLKTIYESDSLDFSILHDYQTPDRVEVNSNFVINKQSTLSLQYTTKVKNDSGQVKSNTKIIPVNFEQLEILTDSEGISYITTTSSITTQDANIEFKFYFYSLRQRPSN